MNEKEVHRNGYFMVMILYILLTIVFTGSFVMK